MKPYWKVVSVNNGTNSWTIPAGYRFYKVYMRCTASAPSSSSQVYLACDSKSATAYTTGVYQTSSTVAATAVTFGTDTTAIAPLSTAGASSGTLSPNVRFDLSRLSTTSTSLAGFYSATGGGSDWSISGKLEFTVTSSGDFTMSFSRGGGSSLANFAGYVEALVEP